MGTRAAANSLTLLAASVVSRLASLAVAGYLARRLGAYGLGAYNLVVVYATMATIVGDLGITAYVTREISAAPDRQRRLLREGSVASLTASVVSVLVCNVVAWAAGYPSDLRLWIFIATAAGFLSPALLPMALLQARLQGGKVALINLSGQAMSIATTVYVILAGRGIETIVLLQVAVVAGMTILVLSFARAWGTYVPLPRPAEFARGMRMIGGSISMGAIQALAFIPSRLDTLVLSVVGARSGVAYYTGAWRLSESFHMIPIAVVASVFPISSRLGTLSPAALARTLRIALRYLALVGIPLLAGVLVLAGPIVRAIYGPHLTATAGPLRVLMGSEAVFFFGSVTASALVGMRLMKRLLIMGAVVVPLNVMACLALLPSLGYRAAGWITLATELAGTTSMLTMARRHLRQPVLPLRSIARSAAASAAMAGVLVVSMKTLGLSMAPAVVVAAAVYLLLLVLTRELGEEDLVLARRLIALRRTPTDAEYELPDPV